MLTKIQAYDFQIKVYKTISLKLIQYMEYQVYIKLFIDVNFDILSF